MYGVSERELWGSITEDGDEFGGCGMRIWRGAWVPSRVDVFPRWQIGSRSS